MPSKKTSPKYATEARGAGASGNTMARDVAAAREDSSGETTAATDARCSRRVFVGATGLAAVGSWATPEAGVYAQPAESESPKPVRLGVMGLSRGSALAVGFAALPGVQIAYLCDVDSNRAAACAKRLGERPGQQPRTVTDFRRILDDPQVDALVCAAPNHWHGPATILACQAGKHVYVEKPCSHNPQEGEWMVQAARQHGRAVQVGTQRRSSPGMQAAMEKIAAGAIGNVHLARCWYYSQRGPIGTGTPSDPPPHLDYELWQGPAPREPYRSNVVHYNWHWFWHWGNGELGNNGVHTIDLCRWGLGVDYPSRVTSSGGRYFFEDDQQTPDTQTVCFEFPGNRMLTWEGLSCNRNGDRFVRLYGDNGSVDLRSDGRYTFFDRNNKETETGGGGNQGDREHLENFLAAVRSDDPAGLNTDILEGHRSTLLCHLGNIAQRTGRTLNCQPEDGHILDDDSAEALWRRDYAPQWESLLT